VAILKGDSGDKIVPGAALCSQGDRPFRGLSPFGNNFLSRFEGVEMDSPILNNITLVDTPGILSGQKQSIGRNYDYEQVMKWFAERADLIIMYVPIFKLWSFFLLPLSHSRNDSLSLTSLLLLQMKKLQHV
jgi:EH domain-containing protein 1